MDSLPTSSVPLLDSLPFAVVLLDSNLRIQCANDEARRLLGLAAASGGGAFPDLWSALTQRPSTAIRAELEHAQVTRRPIRGSRIHLRPAGGRSVAVEWTCVPSDIPGCASGLTVSLRDLSREDELQEDRDRLAAMAEESPSPIIEMDAEAQILYANPAMAAWLLKLGYEADGYPAMLPRALPALVARCLQSGMPVKEDVFLSEASFAWTFCPVIRHGMVRGYALDMTQIHETERALRRTADELHESNRRLDQALTEAHESARAKTAFLATVSHELRTPMNGVIGMTGLLMETTLTPEQRSYTDTIRQCGEALLQLINDVLESSKIEAGKLELEQLSFDLRTTVEHVLAQFAERAEAKGLELTGLVHAAVPTALCGDPGRLRQVLTNLVGNAVKFTERGDVTLQAYVDEETVDSALIRFEVTDNGIGIPLETQAKLFRPFVQADSSTTRKYGGTGLGLSISKELIELMGGRIGVNSAPGQGSTFWCTIRFSKQPDSPRAILPSTDLTGRRVLIVDDNDSNRLILHALVTGWGMADEIAEDAASALTRIEAAVAQGRPFDVVILDVMMPAKDGLQFARELQRHPACSSLRIVVMTSLLQRGHAEQARQAGAMGYLPKPIRHDQLRDCLRAVLGIQRVVSGDGCPPASPSPLITRHTLAEQMQSVRVLIVEDNIVNQKLAVRMVEKLGYRPDVVENGREALTALRAGTYAAVLMDCQMPVMDGFEATRKIREHEASLGLGPRPDGLSVVQVDGSVPHIPIIAVTANAMEGDRERCLAAGMDDYLAKPVKLEELRSILQRWIALDRPPRTTLPAEPTFPATEQGVFDVDKMWRQIGGDHELFAQLVALFLERHEEALTDIQAAIFRKDALAVERIAHTLKGTAGNLCAPAVALAASRLEAVGHLERLEEAPSVYGQLELEVKRTVRVLERYRDGYRSRDEPAA